MGMRHVLHCGTLDLLPRVDAGSDIRHYLYCDHTWALAALHHVHAPFLVALAGAAFHLTRSQMVGIGIVLWLPMYLAAIGLSSAYIHARTLNAVWNHLRIGPIRFSSSLRVRDVIAIYVTNAVAVVLTVGFATPWAVIRSWRYRASKTALIAAGPLDGFVQAEADHIGAAGQEIGDMLDFDVSL